MGERDYWINRTICDVLKEIRKCHETRNYSYLLALTEEAQSLANKMEASLYDKKDLQAARKEVVKLKKEIKELREKRNELKEKTDSK